MVERRIACLRFEIVAFWRICIWWYLMIWETGSASALKLDQNFVHELHIHHEYMFINDESYSAWNEMLNFLANKGWEWSHKSYLLIAYLTSKLIFWVIYFQDNFKLCCIWYMYFGYQIFASDHMHSMFGRPPNCMKIHYISVNVRYWWYFIALLKLLEASRILERLFLRKDHFSIVYFQMIEAKSHVIQVVNVLSLNKM